jgi:hypothetical protein
VRYAADAFFEEQAAIWRGGKQSPAAGFLHQVLVIFLRFKAEQR